jgi:hypothetical protein
MVKIIYIFTKKRISVYIRNKKTGGFIMKKLLLVLVLVASVFLVSGFGDFLFNHKNDQSKLNFYDETPSSNTTDGWNRWMLGTLEN